MIKKQNKNMTKSEANTLEEQQNKFSQQRRRVMQGVVALGVCTSASPCLSTEKKSTAVDPDDPSQQLPQENDCLVHADGEKEGQLLDVNDLEEGKAFVNCWPRDPETGTVRSGSRYNKLMAIRLNEEKLDSKTKAYSDNGVLVFSAICTHQGCDISAWVEEKQEFFCYCHYSRFNPMKFGKVAYGPARKKLPMIPVRVEDGVAKINGEFSRKPG